MAVEVLKTPDGRALRLAAETCHGFMYHDLAPLPEQVEELFAGLADGLAEFADMADTVPADDKEDFDKAVDRFLAALQAFGFGIGFVSAEAKIQEKPYTIIHLFIGPSESFPATAELPEKVAAEFAA